jgi:hypothetical protein
MDNINIFIPNNLNITITGTIYKDTGLPTPIQEQQYTSNMTIPGISNKDIQVYFNPLLKVNKSNLQRLYSNYISKNPDIVKLPFLKESEYIKLNQSMNKPINTFYDSIGNTAVKVNENTINVTTTTSVNIYTKDTSGDWYDKNKIKYDITQTFNEIIIATTGTVETYTKNDLKDLEFAVTNEIVSNNISLAIDTIFTEKSIIQLGEKQYIIINVDYDKNSWEYNKLLKKISKPIIKPEIETKIIAIIKEQISKKISTKCTQSTRIDIDEYIDIAEDIINDIDENTQIIPLFKSTNDLIQYKNYINSIFENNKILDKQKIPLNIRFGNNKKFKNYISILDAYNSCTTKTIVGGTSYSQFFKPYFNISKTVSQIMHLKKLNQNLTTMNLESDTNILPKLGFIPANLTAYIKEHHLDKSNYNHNTHRYEVDSTITNILNNIISSKPIIINLDNEQYIQDFFIDKYQISIIFLKEESDKTIKITFPGNQSTAEKYVFVYRKNNRYNLINFNTTTPITTTFLFNTAEIKKENINDLTKMPPLFFLLFLYKKREHKHDKGRYSSISTANYTIFSELFEEMEKYIDKLKQLNTVFYDFLENKRNDISTDISTNIIKSTYSYNITIKLDLYEGNDLEKFNKQNIKCKITGNKIQYNVSNYFSENIYNPFIKLTGIPISESTKFDKSLLELVPNKQGQKIEKKPDQKSISQKILSLNPFNLKQLKAKKGGNKSRKGKKNRRNKTRKKRKYSN